MRISEREFKLWVCPKCDNYRAPTKRFDPPVCIGIYEKWQPHKPERMQVITTREPSGQSGAASDYEMDRRGGYA